MLKTFDYTKVDETVRRIVEAVDPGMTIVFGSVARREANEHSVLDLLVVMDEIGDRRLVYSIVAKQFIGLRLPFDLALMEYERFLRYKDSECSFAHEIVTTGEAVYVQ